MERELERSEGASEKGRKQVKGVKGREQGQGVRKGGKGRDLEEVCYDSDFEARAE